MIQLIYLKGLLITRIGLPRIPCKKEGKAKVMSARWNQNLIFTLETRSNNILILSQKQCTSNNSMHSGHDHPILPTKTQIRNGYIKLLKITLCCIDFLVMKCMSESRHNYLILLLSFSYRKKPCQQAGDVCGENLSFQNISTDGQMMYVPFRVLTWKLLTKTLLLHR